MGIYAPTFPFYHASVVREGRKERRKKIESKEGWRGGRVRREEERVGGRVGRNVVRVQHIAFFFYCILFANFLKK